MARPPAFAAAAVLLLFVAVAAGTFRPARRLAPGLHGLVCGAGPVCAEDSESLARAQALYAQAARSVGEQLAVLRQPAPVIFCATRSCGDYFGVHTARAQTTGPFGTVIGPEGWLPHVVRHELIHQVQNEQLGRYRMHREPQWFIEGMAYAFSEDPRADLGAPWQQQRQQFRDWYAAAPASQLWERARQLR